MTTKDYKAATAELRAMRREFRDHRIATNTASDDDLFVAWSERACRYTNSFLVSLKEAMFGMLDRDRVLVWNEAMSWRHGS